MALAVVVAPALGADNEHGIAVIVGNKAYDGETPAVDFAHNDAEAMKRFVINVLGYREGNVIDLRDATKGKLETVFGNARDHRGQLFNWVKAGKSNVVVFYSGHGVPDTEGRSYLLPVDGDPEFGHIGGYALDVLYENLAKIDAPSITVYLDTCFSGQTPRGYLLEGSGVVPTPREIATPAKLTILTAAQADQMARWDEESGHGLFTAHLLKALGGEADRADWGDGNGEVTLAEARAYLDEEMSYQARRRYGKPQAVMAVGDETSVLAALTTEPEEEEEESEAEWEEEEEEESEAEWEVEPLDEQLVALRNANVRSVPSTDGDKLETLPTGTEVTVTGKVWFLSSDEDGDWYRIALADGAEAYVWAPLVGEAQGLVPEPATELSLAVWDRIVDSNRAADFESFLTQYPNSPMASFASNRLAELRRVAVVSPPPAPEATASTHRVGESFRECTGCPEMVVVPGGSFQMGSPSDEEGRYDDEEPLHHVSVPQALAVGKYEVTFSQWDACVSAGGCDHDAEDAGWGRGSQPVIDVSWTDAQEYVRWLSRETGSEYRLLSEAEWEYAARAGTQTARYWGGYIGDNQANCDGCGSPWDDMQTAPIGSFAPNAFGLYDMLGNVLEWTQDCSNGDYSGAPTHSIAWQGDSDCSRVLRGGSWYNTPRLVRSAARQWTDNDTREYQYGFRVARTLF